MLKRLLRINITNIRNVDCLMLVVTVIITILGIMTIYSATRPILDASQQQFYLKQAVWFILGLIALFITISFDYTRLMKYAYHIYIFGVILLFVTILLGHSGMGAQRWLRIGPLSFQPSEFFRIALIIGASKYLSVKGTPLSISPLSVILSFFGVLPFVLLYKQPDLGSALILIFVLTVITIIKGIRRRLLLSLVSIALISMPFVSSILWEGLKEYQRNRLVAFLDPGADPRGIGYQIEQSKITIGSGELAGKGYLKGTQGPFRFLPEKHTDFIFSVFSEEWGFIGSVILIGLYLVLIVRGFETAYYAKDEFGTLISIGISTMFLFYVTVNIGMTMGLMPVVGIPLPFFSYGGTALLSNFVCVGLLINIRMRRFTLFY